MPTAQTVTVAPVLARSGFSNDAVFMTLSVKICPMVLLTEARMTNPLLR